MLVNQSALNALSRTFQAIFMLGMQDTKTLYQLLSTVVPSTTKGNDYGWLGDMPVMREWLGDRVIKGLKAGTYSIDNKDWEATVGVNKNDIADDNLGIYAPMIRALAVQAATHPDKLIFALLAAGFTSTCYDGQYFFDTDHPVGSGTVSNHGGGASTPWFLLCTTSVLMPFIFQMRQAPELVEQDDPKTNENAFMRKLFVYGVDGRWNAGYGLWQLAFGSKQTLDATNYQAARTAMLSFKNDEGEPLNVVPDLLVVPPSLEGAGRELLEAERDASGATNVYRSTAKLLVAPRLAA